MWQPCFCGKVPPWAEHIWFWVPTVGWHKKQQEEVSEPGGPTRGLSGQFSKGGSDPTRAVAGSLLRGLGYVQIRVTLARTDSLA